MYALRYALCAVSCSSEGTFGERRWVETVEEECDGKSRRCLAGGGSSLARWVAAGIRSAVSKSHVV